ncbi:MAG: M23 family metallopeptidase, partial [Thermoleophilia bacterium]|nr:M23 family metallopeptidase [Thermoleophilia bacterium]
MTRRALLPILLLAGVVALPVAVAAAASAPPAGGVPRLIFPVVGTVTYGNDYGDARGGGRHEGNDLMAARRAPAVAAEGGTVSFWTRSARAGCMLTLRGDSGTHYLYIHLNNDLTGRNDNRGGCVPGVAYAAGLRSGDRVEAGAPVGFVGNSGDADATAPHLHFEVHPRGGAAVNPYPHLRRARRLLFAAPLGSAATLALRGRVVAASDGGVRMRVESLRRWPGGLLLRPGRLVDLGLGPGALLLDADGSAVEPARLVRAR